MSPFATLLIASSDLSVIFDWLKLLSASLAMTYSLLFHCSIPETFSFANPCANAEINNTKMLIRIELKLQVNI